MAIIPATLLTKQDVDYISAELEVCVTRLCAVVRLTLDTNTEALAVQFLKAINDLRLQQHALWEMRGSLPNEQG